MLLQTIQRSNKLNEVICVDPIGPGGAYHKYVIRKYEDVHPPAVAPSVAIIEFQNGPRKNPESVCGVLDGDLLEIVRHRLQCFQQGNFATKENEKALQHIEEALMWMNKRVEDRAEKGVLGTTNK